MSLLGLPTGAEVSANGKTFVVPHVGKIFAAIGPGDYVLFTVTACNATRAREAVRSVKRNSESVYSVRLLRFDDMPSEGREFAPHRGG